MLINTKVFNKTKKTKLKNKKIRKTKRYQNLDMI